MVIDYNIEFNMIIVESQPDCSDFRGIIDGLPGDLLVNPSKGQARRMINSHPERPLVVTGHGDSMGLYNMNWNGYTLTSTDVQLLRNVPCIIGVWCYASEFADRYGLHGFFTSMFISNHRESLLEQREAPEEQITKHNRLFADSLNHLIRTEPDVSQWVSMLQSEVNEDSPSFMRFNYEALSYYN